MPRIAKMALSLAMVLAVAAAGTVASNILTLSSVQEVGTVDPARATDYTETISVINIYDPLVFPDGNGVVQPKLAQTWDVSEDALTYTFYLRQDAVFHDGTQVFAEDVAFSMERMLALKDGYSWMWTDLISEIDVVDDYTVSFTLREPFTPFLATLPAFCVLNKDLVVAHTQPGDYGDYGDYGVEWLNTAVDTDAGSGPYTLRSWDRGRAIVFARFDDYFLGWQQGDKSVDEAHMFNLPATATLKTMLRSGELVMTDNLRTFEDYEDMSAYNGVTVIPADTGQQITFKINTKAAPTDDIHIRRMLAWAFDYAMAITEISPGSLQSRGPVPSAIPGQNPDLFQYTQDLDKAREELELSSYYPNVPTLHIVMGIGAEAWRRMALSLQAALATIGVNLEIHMETWGRMCELAAQPETTPNLMAIIQAPMYSDPDTFLYSMYHSDAAGTWMSTEWLQNDTVDELISESRRTVDPAARQELLSTAQEIIVDECPDIFIYQARLYYAMQDYVRGFTYRPVMSYEFYFHDLWFER